MWRLHRSATSLSFLLDAHEPLEVFAPARLSLSVVLQLRARKIFSVPVAGLFWPDQAPFFWSHFLSSWSQSCARTQKLRRKEKKKKKLIFEGSFCTHPNTNIINHMKQVFFCNGNRRKEK